MRDQGRLVVLGWTTSAALEVTLIQDGRSGPARIERHHREDVALALNLPPTVPLGFSILSDAPLGPSVVELSLAVPGGGSIRTGVLSEAPELPARYRALVPALNEANLARLRLLAPGSREWRDLLSELPVVQVAPKDHAAHVEGALVSPEGGGVVFGWALHAPDALVWIEDEQGNVRPLSQAFRRERQDIRDSFPANPWSDQDAAFVIHLPELSEQPVIALKVATRHGIATLAKRTGGEMLSADPRRAAEKLFSIQTEQQTFHRRAGLVDWPVLKPLIRRRGAELSDLPARRKDFGPRPGAPEVSVIVPLYRRFDFVEHQLLEFRRDAEFRDRCELIYVIDDPSIEAEVLTAAGHLHRLLDLPFTVVSGRRNRGYSGANNLGADHARGRHLLFLNSDVIPQGPGWLGPMRALLDADASVGIVGPRLLFAHGGLQHAGMSFEWLEALGIWINRHPGAGLSPDLDPAPGPVEVPAVTGACLLMPRKVFDELGGWDSGYLVGDFEDSDLCLTARQSGYKVLYQPDVQLTHLERQSGSLRSLGSFELRVKIANALRHQQRWGNMLNGDATPVHADEPFIVRQEMIA